MGMYTGFKLEVEIKEDLIEFIEMVVKERDFSPLIPALDEKGQESLRQYLHKDRHNHIFSLVGQGTFSGYENNEEWDLEEEGPSRLDGNVLKIYGSLKNYDQVIEDFISLVLPLISKKTLIAQKWYEEAEEPVNLLE